MPEFMTVQELAGYLRVTEKTIYRMLERGSVPAGKVGRQWRFNKAAIDKWVRQKSTKVKASILVIDDDEKIRSLFVDTLESVGHTVSQSATSYEGLELVRRQDFDLIFLDLKMPDLDGAELFRQIKATKPEVPVIIITGYPDSEMMARALAVGPLGVMSKPFDSSDIITAVKNFLPIKKRGVVSRGVTHGRKAILR